MTNNNHEAQAPSFCAFMWVFSLWYQQVYHNSGFLIFHCFVKSLKQQIQSTVHVMPCSVVEKPIQETNACFTHTVQVWWPSNVSNVIFILWLLHGQAENVGSSRLHAIVSRKDFINGRKYQDIVDNRNGMWSKSRGLTIAKLDYGTVICIGRRTVAFFPR